MLPKYFVQTELNDTENAHKLSKILLRCSYALKLSSLIFIGLTAINIWFLVGFVIIYIGGIVLQQRVLQMPSHYEYFFINGCLMVSVSNNFQQYKTLCEIPLKNTEIKKIETKKINYKDKNLIFACPQGRESYKIEFNNKNKTLVFAPSKYMVALIKAHNTIQYEEI